MRDLRIVFMGTPDFAVAGLQKLVENKYTVVGVITAPDRPAGRGQKIQQSAVKQYASQANLPVLQPTNLKDPEFIEELKALNANLQIVVAFRMLPEVVWKMPEYGTFNLHASLLPDYRGAAPINWAIIKGEKETGVTTFFIDEKIDTGAMILKEEVSIGENETAGELHDRLMELGKGAVIKTLSLIEEGKAVTTIQQDTANIKTAYKLNKDNCRIDWSKTGAEIHNLVRGLSPYPAAWTYFTDNGQEWNVKVYETAFESVMPNEEAGAIVSTKKEIKIAVKDGYLNIKSLQFPGKKKMAAHELLNGMQFSDAAKAL